MATNDNIKAHLDFIFAEVANTQGIKNYVVNSEINTNDVDGYIAQFFTGEIQNEDTGKTISVAIKKTQSVEHDYRVLFNNEYVFYKTAFPALEDLQEESQVPQPFNNVPIYYCGTITEPTLEYIAMEYLKPRGYVMHDRTAFFDQEHLKLIFQTYGKFHALSYVLRKIQPDIYKKITKDLVSAAPTLLEFGDRQVKSVISATVQALDREKYKDMSACLQNLEKNIETIFLKAFEYNGEHRCLVHGDGWSNNMLFKYSDSRKLMNMKLLDFQLCRDATPIHDLSFFFYSGASSKDFDNIEYFLRIYYKSFSEFAKELGANPRDLFSFEVFVNEWKENALLGVIFGIWSWLLKLTNKEDFNKRINKKNNLSEEDRQKMWKDYLKTIYESSIYKEKATSILIHAIEYSIIRKDNIALN